MARPTYTTPEGRATKDAILDAAVEAFAARGYRGASIDSIAAAVGVSRQGVLHHFPSKVKLLIAVLDRRDQQDMEHGAKVREEIGGSLLKTIRASQDYRAERRGLAQLYTILSAEAVDRDHPAHEYFVERYNTVRTIFTEMIATAQAEGRVSIAVPSEQLAAVLVAIMDGLQLQDQLDHDAVDVEQIFATLLEAFVKED